MAGEKRPRARMLMNGNGSIAHKNAQEGLKAKAKAKPPAVHVHHSNEMKCLREQSKCLACFSRDGNCSKFWSELPCNYGRRRRGGGR